MNENFITPADRFLVNQCKSEFSKNTEPVNHHYYSVNPYYPENSSFWRDMWLINKLDRQSRYNHFSYAGPDLDICPTLSEKNDSKEKENKDKKKPTMLEVMATMAVALGVTAAASVSVAYLSNKLPKAFDNLRTPRKIIKSVSRLGAAVVGAASGSYLAFVLTDMFMFSGVGSAMMQYELAIKTLGVIGCGLIGSSIGVWGTKLFHKIFNPFIKGDKESLSQGVLNRLNRNDTYMLSKGQALIANRYLLGKIVAAEELANHENILFQDDRFLHLFHTLRTEGLKKGDPNVLVRLKDYFEAERNQMNDIIANQDWAAIPAGLTPRSVYKLLIDLEFVVGNIEPAEYQYFVENPFKFEVKQSRAKEQFWQFNDLSKAFGLNEKFKHEMEADISSNRRKFR